MNIPRRIGLLVGALGGGFLGGLGYVLTLWVGARIVLLVLLGVVPPLLLVRIRIKGNQLNYRGLIRRRSFTKDEVGHVSVIVTSVRGTRGIETRKQGSRR